MVPKRAAGRSYARAVQSALTIIDGFTDESMIPRDSNIETQVRTNGHGQPLGR